MNPIRAHSLDAITRAVSRHYLRPLTLAPDPANCDRWTVCIEHREIQPKTEIIHREGIYTFQDAPQNPKP